MGLIYGEFLTAGKSAVTIRARMRPDRAAPQSEMVNAASERLSEGTILAADGYGLVMGENCEERETTAEL
jgi:hypothetical protein